MGDWTDIVPSDSVILLGYQGSLAHGTYVEGHIDDVDLLAVVVPGIEHYLGLRKWGRQGTKVTQRGKWDVTMHELRKFVSLCAKGNPNVLGLLWLEDYLYHTHAGRLLAAHRDLFATKAAYRSFAGYASGQLHRMTRAENKYEGYMGAKRKALVDKYGYDPKNASHLIRLLLMGEEFLRTGYLRVKRPDADMLMAIKRGEWSLLQVRTKAFELFKMTELARDESPLPDEPDMDAINHLCVQVAGMAFNDRNWKEATK